LDGGDWEGYLCRKEGGSTPHKNPAGRNHPFQRSKRWGTATVTSKETLAMIRRWIGGIIIMLGGLWLLAAQDGVEGKQTSGQQPKRETPPAAEAGASAW
ncbi:MAG TPA: hypothetical protein PK777_05710, partial [Thermoguttaceae bacterium]|nr:hypothetical protein [Thermoguttaceae bacterium]